MSAEFVAHMEDVLDLAAYSNRESMFQSSSGQKAGCNMITS